MKQTIADFLWARLFILMFLTVFLGFAFPRSAAAQKATIEDFFINNSNTHVLLYFIVKNCFTTEMETGIQNGIPATFTFYVDLYQVKKAWPDKKIASHVFHHTLTYDNLKEEYNVHYSLDDKTVVTKSPEQAKKIMSEVNDFEITELDNLQTGKSYVLRVKAKLAKKTLPLYFHYLIPFSSLWDFETDWHTLKFKY